MGVVYWRWWFHALFFGKSDRSRGDVLSCKLIMESDEAEDTVGGAADEGEKVEAKSEGCAFR